MGRNRQHYPFEPSLLSDDISIFKCLVLSRFDYRNQGFTPREFTSTRFAQVNSTRKLDSRIRTSLPKIKIK